MHDVVIVDVPILVILAGIVFNRNDVKELRNEAAARHTEVLSRLSNIDGDLRQFYQLTGKLEGRMDTIEKR